MTVNETYNIHKEINCIFPFFKSKRLCKKGLHIYEFYKTSNKWKWKCSCCGKEEEIE